MGRVVVIKRGNWDSSDFSDFSDNSDNSED